MYGCLGTLRCQNLDLDLANLSALGIKLGASESSVFVLVAILNVGCYGICLSRAGSADMLRTVIDAVDAGQPRFRVNSLYSGMIDTDFHDRYTQPEVRKTVAGGLTS